MIVRVGLAPRAKGLDLVGFQDHWRSQHADLALHIPGLRAYVQNHSVLVDGCPLQAWPGFDACAETSFDSLEAMDAGFASEEYQRDVRADEDVLIDKAAFFFALCELRVLGAPPEGARGRREADAPDLAPPAKLITMLRAHPASSARELDEALGGPYAAALSDAGAIGHEQLVVIPGAHDGRTPAPFDALDILYFPTASDAVAHVVSQVATEAAGHLAGIAFGRERLVARPRVMR